jgi:hypothetical protein
MSASEGCMRGYLYKTPGAAAAAPITQALQWQPLSTARVHMRLQLLLGFRCCLCSYLMYCDIQRKPSP